MSKNRRKLGHFRATVSDQEQHIGAKLVKTDEYNIENAEYVW
jgi:hypothetical protein